MQTARTYNRFSYGAWVNPSASPVSDTILWKNNEFRLQTDASAIPTCSIYYSGAWQTAATATSIIPTSEWTHLMCVYDGTTLWTYVNGVPEGSQTLGGSVASSTNALNVARTSAGAGYFAGRIDDIRIYPIALPPAFVGQVMTNGALQFR